MKRIEPALRFVEHLFSRPGALSGWLVFRAFDSSKKMSPKWLHVHSDDADGIEKALEFWCTQRNREGYCIFMGVNPRPEEGKDRAADVPLAHVVVTELDLEKDVPTHEAALAKANAQAVKPTMIIDSGSGGLHIYTVLDEPIEAYESNTIGRGLKTALGVEDDVWGIERVWRLPGFENLKRGENDERIRGKVSIVQLDHEGRTATKAEMADMLGLPLPLPNTDKKPKQPQRKRTKADGTTSPVGVAPLWCRTNLRPLWEREHKAAMSRHGDASKADMRVACAIARHRQVTVESLMACISHVRSQRVGDLKAYRRDYLESTAREALTRTYGTHDAYELNERGEALADARKRLRALTEKAASSTINRGQSHMFDVPAGTGKTYTWARYVSLFAQGDLTKHPVTFVARSYEHLEEFRALAAKMSDGKLRHQMAESMSEACQNTNVAAYIEHHGGYWPGQRAACTGCEFIATCAAQQRQDTGAHLVLMTHHMLATLDASDPLVKGRVVVIDEVPEDTQDMAFTRSMLANAQLKAFKYWPDAGETLKALNESTHTAVIQTLAKGQEHIEPLSGGELRKALAQHHGPRLTRLLQATSENPPDVRHPSGKAIRKGIDPEKLTAFTPAHVELLEKIRQVMLGEIVNDMWLSIQKDGHWEFKVARPLRMKARIPFVGLDATYRFQEGNWKRFTGEQCIEHHEGTVRSARGSSTIRIHVPVSCYRSQIAKSNIPSGDRLTRLTDVIENNVLPKLEALGFSDVDRAGIVTYRPISRVINEPALPGAYGDFTQTVKGLAADVQTVDWHKDTRGTNRLEGVDTLWMIGEPLVNLGEHKRKHIAKGLSEDTHQTEYANLAAAEMLQAERRARAGNTAGQRTAIICINHKPPQHWLGENYIEVEVNDACAPKTQRVLTAEVIVERMVRLFGIASGNLIADWYQALMGKYAESGTELLLPLNAHIDFVAVAHHVRRRQLRETITENLGVTDFPKVSKRKLVGIVKAVGKRLEAEGEFRNTAVIGYRSKRNPVSRAEWSSEQCTEVYRYWSKALKTDALHMLEVPAALSELEPSAPSQATRSSHHARLGQPASAQSPAQNSASPQMLGSLGYTAQSVGDPPRSYPEPLRLRRVRGS